MHSKTGIVFVFIKTDRICVKATAIFGNSFKVLAFSLYKFKGIFQKMHAYIAYHALTLFQSRSMRSFIPLLTLFIIIETACPTLENNTHNEVENYINDSTRILFLLKA